MATPREQARAELRRSIDVLPERTRKAMLVGLGNNTVITGAFAASKDGACPMMAAHREGGRTSCCTFPEAWDKFTGVYGRFIVREATPYEVQILCEEIQASLQPLPNVLSDAIAEHQAIVAARRHETTVAEPEQSVAAEEQAVPAAPRRKRRLRITGGHLDLSEAIDEHKSAARTRRSREADDLGIDWLFEETLVLPEDFGNEPVAPDPPSHAGDFDFDAAEAQLTS
ncbi:MAG: hypothetical protein QOG42_434 [Solirubrobacteraceae bacterium]|nr:hypothetical protein [Solirubrobacteraceae bacterium]